MYVKNTKIPKQSWASNFPQQVKSQEAWPSFDSEAEKLSHTSKLKRKIRSFLSGSTALASCLTLNAHLCQWQFSELFEFSWNSRAEKCFLGEWKTFFSRCDTQYSSKCALNSAVVHELQVPVQVMGTLHEERLSVVNELCFRLAVPDSLFENLDKAGSKPCSVLLKRAIVLKDHHGEWHKMHNAALKAREYAWEQLHRWEGGWSSRRRVRWRHCTRVSPKDSQIPNTGAVRCNKQQLGSTTVLF